MGVRCRVFVSPCKHFMCDFIIIIIIKNIVAESHRLWYKFEFCGQVGSQDGQTNAHESHGFLFFISIFSCYRIQNPENATSLKFHSIMKQAYILSPSWFVMCSGISNGMQKFFRCANKRGLFGMHTVISCESENKLFVCSQSHFRCECHLFSVRIARY